MALPASWVDELMRRLTVRYGEAFLRQYERAGVSPDDMRADWAQVLGTCTAEQIAHGLASLNPDHAPNAMQFRALCKTLPDTSMPALPPPSPAGLKRMAEVLAPLKRSGTTFEELYALHCGRRERGEPMSPAQRAWIQAADEKMGGRVSVEFGGGALIPNDVLPPGMRAAA